MARSRSCVDPLVPFPHAVSTRPTERLFGSLGKGCHDDRDPDVKGFSIEICREEKRWSQKALATVVSSSLRHRDKRTPPIWAASPDSSDKYFLMIYG